MAIKKEPVKKSVTELDVECIFMKKPSFVLLGLREKEHGYGTLGIYERRAK